MREEGALVCFDGRAVLTEGRARRGQSDRRGRWGCPLRAEPGPPAMRSAPAKPNVSHHHWRGTEPRGRASPGGPRGQGRREPCRKEYSHAAAGKPLRPWSRLAVSSGSTAHPNCSSSRTLTQRSCCGARPHDWSTSGSSHPACGMTSVTRLTNANSGGKSSCRARRARETMSRDTRGRADSAAY